jgi:hypothetical protein
MLKQLLRGFFFGIGFTIALAIVWSAYSYLILPTIVSRSFAASQVRSIDGDPVNVVPIKPAQPPDERKFELHLGAHSRMQMPPGGGILSLAITDAPKTSDRPSTIQAWITESEAFLIETDGETPTVKKVPYPVQYASELVHEYAGFRAGNSTMMIDAADVGRLRNGIPSERDDFMNGSFRITKEGIVFFIPNRFET